MKKNVSIIIIHHNTLKHLEQLLQRLDSDHHSTEVIVVDNSQSKLLALKKRFTKVTWIENTRNRGFSFAANQGALVSTGRWLLFLNPDVQISISEITDLYHFAEKQKLDAVSPTFKDSRYSKALPTFTSLIAEFTPLNKVAVKLNNSQKTLVGGCLLIRRNVLLELGGWDERFFLWFEDSDLTQRLIDQHFSIGFAPFSVPHEGGASLKQFSSKNARNIFFHSLDIYLKKHFTVSQQKVLSNLIVKRFSSGYLYPALNTGATWVVPNMSIDLLQDFLSTNKQFFEDDELIIVSSSLRFKNMWSLRKKYPDVRFIPIDQNNGFSSTVNIGFQAGTTEFIGTVNDDVILNSESLPLLMKHTKHEFGSLNPVVYTLHQTIESAGIKVFSKGKAEPILETPRYVKSSVDAANGACVLFSSKALNQVGLFDEKFGSYLEDIDLSLRLKKVGFLNYVIRNSTIIHLKHQSSKKFGRYKQFLDMKNWWLVIGKNWTFSEFFYNSPLILLERLRNISGFLRGGLKSPFRNERL